MKSGDIYSYTIRSTRVEHDDGYSINHEFSGVIFDIGNNQTDKVVPFTKNKVFADTADLVDLHEQFLHHSDRKSIETTVTEVIK